MGIISFADLSAIGKGHPIFSVPAAPSFFAFSTWLALTLQSKYWIRPRIAVQFMFISVQIASLVCESDITMHHHEWPRRNYRYEWLGVAFASAIFCQCRRIISRFSSAPCMHWLYVDTETERWRTMQSSLARHETPPASACGAVCMVAIMSRLQRQTVMAACPHPGPTDAKLDPSVSNFVIGRCSHVDGKGATRGLGRPDGARISARDLGVRNDDDTPTWFPSGAADAAADPSSSSSFCRLQLDAIIADRPTDRPDGVNARTRFIRGLQPTVTLQQHTPHTCYWQRPRGFVFDRRQVCNAG